MSRVANILAALVVWAVSSGLLLFMCVFSVNQTIISAALVVAAVTLIGSAVAFATKHDKLGFLVAAGPAVVIAGLLVMFAVYGYTHYYR
jgi:hypothetical protein